MIAVPDDRVLRLPYRGAPQTVGVIRRAALETQNHLSVRRLCEAFCKGVASKDYISEYLACLYGLEAHSRYMRDPRTVEFVKAPHVIADEILSGGVASLDCDDYSGMLSAMGLAMGGATRLVTVAFRPMFYEGRQQYSHVFAQAQEPRTGTWITLDPVAAENTGKMHRDLYAAKVWPVA